VGTGNHASKFIVITRYSLGVCDRVLVMPKQTYQPKKRQRSREHGFMKRMASRAGQKVLARRRAKGRTRLTH